MAQNAHPNSRMSLGGPRMELEKGFGPRRMSNVKDVQQSRRQTLAAPQDSKSPGASRWVEGEGDEGREEANRGDFDCLVIFFSSF